MLLICPARGKVKCNKGGLLENKGGLLENKGGLLKNKRGLLKDKAGLLLDRVWCHGVKVSLISKSNTKKIKKDIFAIYPFLSIYGN